VLNDRYCGLNLYCLGAVATATIATAATDATVCSNQKPFKISVESDGLEYMFPIDAVNAEGAIGNNVGFSISKDYLLITCNFSSLLPGYFMKTTCLTRPTM
jgi:hypothetical protein